MTKNQKIILVAFIAIASLIFPGYLITKNLPIEGMWYTEDMMSGHLILCDGYIIKRHGKKMEKAINQLYVAGTYSKHGHIYEADILGTREYEGSTAELRRGIGLTIYFDDGSQMSLKMKSGSEEERLMNGARQLVAEITKEKQRKMDAHPSQDLEEDTTSRSTQLGTAAGAAAPRR